MTRTPCRYERRWPELFARLDDQQKQNLSAVLANGRLEGWEPTRDEVADLVADALGEISEEEYLRRAYARATGTTAAVG